MIVHPLTQVLIYALILSNILAAKLPGIENKYAYAIYLMAGLLGWTLFSDIITRCMNLFIEKGNLLKKMNFPRITLPCIAIGSCITTNVLLFVSMLVIFSFFGQYPTTAFWWLPMITLILALFAAGIGLILGVLNIFIRDIGQVIPIVLQIWFWFTPVVYPATIIPLEYRDLLNANPLTIFINAYHDILVYGNPPQFQGLATLLPMAVLILVVSLFVFRRANIEIADAL